MTMNYQAGSDWGGLLEPWLRAFAALTSSRAPGDAAVHQQPEAHDLHGLGTGGHLLAVLAQANLALAAALMRFGGRSIQSWAEYQAATGGMRSLVSTSGMDREALATLVDQARAHLRRVGESAVEEARVLDLQMQAIAEQLRAIVEDQPSSSDTPHRYARTKP